MINSALFDSFNEFAVQAVEKSEECDIQLGEICIKLRSNLPSNINQIIFEGFFSAKKVSEWQLNIWCNTKENQLSAIPGIPEFISDNQHLMFVDNEKYIAKDPSGNAIYVLDTRLKFGSIWISSECKSNPDFFLTPFRAIFSWILNTLDCEILHGACFLLNSKIVALSGQSGSGKSVIAHKIMSMGHKTLGDDAFIVGQSGIYALYTRSKLNFDVDIEEIGIDESNWTNFKTKRILQKNKTDIDVFSKRKIDFLFFPKLSINSNLKKMSSNDAAKRLLLENCSETITPNRKSLRRITEISNGANNFEWETIRNPMQNYQDLLEFVSDAK